MEPVSKAICTVKNVNSCQTICLHTRTRPGDEMLLPQIRRKYRDRVDTPKYSEDLDAFLI